MLRTDNWEAASFQRFSTCVKSSEVFGERPPPADHLREWRMLLVGRDIAAMPAIEGEGRIDIAGFADELIDDADPHVVHGRIGGKWQAVIENRSPKCHGTSKVLVANEVLKGAGVKLARWETRLGNDVVITVDDRAIT